MSFSISRISIRLLRDAVARLVLGLSLLGGMAFSASCSAVPSPPYSLAFSLEGQAPRIVHVLEERAVPIRIRNTGDRPWDPSRIHVSYHWLWLIPREIVKRSRTLPYHEGIRTNLEAAVNPGGAVAVQGRLLAPDVPGLYWLQWDMVEEGVTWFAQVSPRQPRQLVIVVPSLAGVLAPLPLLVGMFGLGLFWNANSGSGWAAFVAFADVFWCATALVTKPLLLARDALLEPTSLAYGLIVVAAVVPPLLALAAVRRRVRMWLLLAFGTFGTLLIVGDAIYYRFFGDVISAPALLGARQTGQVWGSVRSLFTAGMIWLVVDVPVVIWFALVTRNLRVRVGPVLRGAAAVAAIALVVASGEVTTSTVSAAQLQKMFRDRAVMEQLGPFGYHAYDAWNYARSTLFRTEVNSEKFEEILAWFGGRSPLRAGTGPAFGVAAGKNLIVIQVESLQDFVVDYQVNGQAVMPHLRDWSSRAVRFTNVTDQTSEGRTSDAEFVALTSLLPLDHGAVAFRFPGNHFVGLPRILAERGYSTLSAVPFESGFWNRRVLHPSYGFQRSLFEPDFQLTEQIGWGLNDHDFLQQMVPRLANLSQPFAAWLITLSLHHPFDDFPERHKVLKLGSLERTSFGNYLHTMHFFDRALADFEAALAKSGFVDRTVLAVFGDHDAGFRREPSLAAAIGVGADDARWELNDRVPFFIRLPDPGDAVQNGERPLAAGQTDIAPTLLALLGVDPGSLPYAGRNLLGQPDNPTLLRRYGDWLNNSYLYIERNTPTSNRSCFALAPAMFVGEEACRAMDASAKFARDITRMVVTGDLQQRLREALKR